MPLAVTHVLLSIIAVDLYRDYITKHRKYFTLHTVFLAGFFGLLPDIDKILEIIVPLFNPNILWLFEHGGITHTPFFALLFLVPGLILWKKKKHKSAAYFYVATFAILFHIFLDYLIGGGRFEGIMWLFPLSFEGYKIHLINYFGLANLPQALDALILLGWLFLFMRLNPLGQCFQASI